MMITSFNFGFIVENKDLLENFVKLKDLANSMTTYDDEQKRLQNLIRLETATNLKYIFILHIYLL